MRKSKHAVRVRKPVCETLEARTLFATGFQVVGYLPDYEFSHFNSIDLNALTHIDYFAIIASSTGSLSSTSSSGYGFSQLQTVVTAAHAANPRVSVNITIDPSSQFLAIAQSSTATTNFVNNILSFCSTYHLDGIDLDYEPDNNSLTQAQMNSWGGFLATLHAATSTHGLQLSEAVQVSKPYIIPQAYLSDVDVYNVMVYALDYNSSAPYSESLTYLAGWANYGVPKAKLMFGMPFYGSSGTSWNNSTAETYAQIMNGYAAANGGAFPAASLDSVTINGTTWGYNGVTTVENKTQYALQNGYGGVMIWETGQDYFTSGGKYGAPSLLPAIKSVVGAAYETWTGSISSNWSTAGNWNFGQVPVSTTNVIVNSGAVNVSSPFSVTSLVLNGGTLTLASGGNVYTTDSLTIAAGATLNLADNTLFVNYGSAADPIGTIAGLIASGYVGGTWTGTGIMSTVAQSNPATYGIGYADSADPGNPAGLASGQIKIMYTLLGDANLDGKVNGTDFNILAANFNTGGDSWDQGDFNYDGKVNGSDFNALAANFNQGLSAGIVAAPVATTSNTDSGGVTFTLDPSDSTTPATHRHRSLHKK